MKKLYKSNGRKILLSLSAALGLFSGSGLFAQQTYTFTNCTATGNAGPTQGMVTGAYALTNLAGNVTVIGNGIQQFVVTNGGLFRVTALGASGGTSTLTPRTAGLGAKVVGEFFLNPGDVLRILVGQMGQLNRDYAASGGGATYVTKTPHNTTASILLVAGGGGGPSGDMNGIDAVTVNCGTFEATSGPGQCNGDGGISFTGNSGGGGGGFFLDGQAGGIGFGGQSYVNGGLGGNAAGNIGGFGGGGANATGGTYCGNGGGGFSGGNGGNRGSATVRPSGGGGGSYNNGTNPVNSVLTTTGHGLVILEELCNISLNASSNPVCRGTAVTLTTNATNVTWNTSATVPTIMVTPSVTTTYSVAGLGLNGSATCSAYRDITIIVNQLPSISGVVNPTMVCAGGSSTITPNGASTYAVGTNTASQFVITPSANTVATISGTNALGCVNTQTFAVKVNANSLSISSSSITVCAGSPVNLTANGVASYTWGNGSHFQSITVNPTTTTTYSSSGRDNFYCLLSNMVTINTTPKPNVQITADKSTVCKGESVNLTASGATSYAWDNGLPGASRLAQLPVDVTYVHSVIGTDAVGCKDTAFIAITVNKCTGINEVTSTLGLKVYPNPTKGEFMIESATEDNKTVVVSDVTGKVVLEQTLKANVAINMTRFASGIYYVKVQSTQGVEVLKVVKE